MTRTIAYWATTAIAALALLGSLSYLTGNEQVVSGFAKAGYPQHLRIVLGIAKPAAAIVLLVPGLALCKEWAYAGVTFAWVMRGSSDRCVSRLSTLRAQRPTSPETASSLGGVSRLKRVTMRGRCKGCSLFVVDSLNHSSLVSDRESLIVGSWHPESASRVSVAAP